MITPLNNSQFPHFDLASGNKSHYSEFQFTLATLVGMSIGQFITTLLMYQLSCQFSNQIANFKTSGLKKLVDSKGAVMLFLKLRNKFAVCLTN